MYDFSAFIKYDKYRVTEAAGIVKTFQQLGIFLCLCFICSFPWIVVYMYINEIVINETADFAVSGDVIGKHKTPAAPVASNLTYYIFSLRFCFDNCLVDLLHRIDRFVVNLLQIALCTSGNREECRQ